MGSHGMLTLDPGFLTAFPRVPYAGLLIGLPTEPEAGRRRRWPKVFQIRPPEWEDAAQRQWDALGEAWSVGFHRRLRSPDRVLLTLHKSHARPPMLRRAS